MRIILCIFTISVLCLPGLAVSSTTGSFALTSDAEGTDCRITDDEPGQVLIHIIVREAGEVAAVQFAAPTPGCWNGVTWIGDNIAFPVSIGDTQLGLAIGFGSCLESPIYVGYMAFSTSGQSSPCCEYPVIKVIDDGFPEIPGPIMIQCPAMMEVVGLSGAAVVNVGSGCDCLQVVAVHSTTWGGVKEMFK